MKLVSSFAKRPKTSLRKYSVQKYETAQNCPFFPSLRFPIFSSPFPRWNCRSNKDLVSSFQLVRAVSCKLRFSAILRLILLRFAVNPVISQVWIQNLERTLWQQVVVSQTASKNKIGREILSYLFSIVVFK